MVDPIHAIRLRAVFAAAAAALLVIGALVGVTTDLDAFVKTFTMADAGTSFARVAEADLPAGFEVEGRPGGDHLQLMATRIEFEP